MLRLRLRVAFTLVEIMVVVVIIGLLAMMAMPAISKARETAQRNFCINNLRQIDYAKEQWAIDNNAGTGVTPPADDPGGYSTCLADYIQGGLPYCPADPQKSYSTSYKTNPIGSDPECLIDTNHKLR